MRIQHWYHNSGQHCKVTQLRSAFIRYNFRQKAVSVFPFKNALVASAKIWKRSKTSFSWRKIKWAVDLREVKDFRVLVEPVNDVLKVVCENRGKAVKVSNVFHEKSICERFEPRSHFIRRLSMIVRCVVLNRTVVVDSDWRFDNLCGSHLQNQSLRLSIARIQQASKCSKVFCLHYRNFKWRLTRLAIQPR